MADALQGTGRRAVRAIVCMGAVAFLACGGGGGGGGGQQTCVPPAPTPSQAPLALVQALGQHPVGTELSFQVPANAASLTVIEQVISGPLTVSLPSGGLAPNAATPLKISDPDGTVVFDRTVDPVDPTQAGILFRSTAPGTGAVTLPNSSAGLQLVASGLPGGTWKLVVSDLAYLCALRPSQCAANSATSSGVYDVTVLVKPGSGPGNIPASGTLDLTFNLVAAGLTPPLSAAAAPSDPDLQRVVQTVGALLGRVGISLGTVKYVDVPAAEAAQIASGVPVDDPTACGALSKLFLTAPTGRQVNVFLVPSLYSVKEPALLLAGYDGEIPGPATVSPSSQGGVVVSAMSLRNNQAYCANILDFASCGADQVAYLVAHEIGHHLGLYHPTEAKGTVFDPLSDTATCACQACTANPAQCADASPAPASPHTMEITECTVGGSCGGGDNLMFWEFDSLHSQGLLTPEQGEVMRANPAVY